MLFVILCGLLKCTCISPLYIYTAGHVHATGPQLGCPQLLPRWRKVLQTII